MGGRTPKPRGTQRKKGSAQGAELPAEGRRGPVPELPRADEFLASTRDWWEGTWRSPMATVYQEADVPTLVRLARFIDLEARGQADGIVRTEIRQLEDRFGLSPLARRRLQWEIAQATERKATNPPTARHLHAVDA